MTSRVHLCHQMGLLGLRSFTDPVCLQLTSWFCKVVDRATDRQTARHTCPFGLHCLLHQLKLRLMASRAERQAGTPACQSSTHNRSSHQHCYLGIPMQNAADSNRANNQLLGRLCLLPQAHYNIPLRDNSHMIHDDLSMASHHTSPSHTLSLITAGDATQAMCKAVNNRADTQMLNRGGAACFIENTKIWAHFNRIVAEIEYCEDTCPPYQPKRSGEEIECSGKPPLDAEMDDANLESNSAGLSAFAWHLCEDVASDWGCRGNHQPFRPTQSGNQGNRSPSRNKGSNGLAQNQARQVFAIWSLLSGRVSLSFEKLYFGTLLAKDHLQHSLACPAPVSRCIQPRMRPAFQLHLFKSLLLVILQASVPS